MAGIYLVTTRETYYAEAPQNSYASPGQGTLQELSLAGVAVVLKESLQRHFLII